jgi:hypothetical protein
MSVILILNCYLKFTSLCLIYYVNCECTYDNLPKCKYNLRINGCNGCDNGGHWGIESRISGLLG